MQDMLLDRHSIHEGAIGTAQVLEKRVVQYGHDQGMFAADGKIVDLQIVMRPTSDCQTLFVEGDLPDYRPIKTKNEICHGKYPVLI
jgi:hypothetical protein